MTGSGRIDRLTLAAAGASILLLAVVIATSPPSRVYDERWYLNYVEATRDVGWLQATTAKNSSHGASVGPVYPAIHLAVSPFTGVQPPGARWVNFVGLLIVIATLARTLPGTERRHGLIGASSILAVPFLWPTAGLALTEIPAMIFFSFAVLWMVKVIGVPEAEVSPRTYAWAVIAGVLFGTSVLARQTYLVAVPAMPLLTIVSPRRWKLWLTATVTTILVCGWLFIVWGGLIPPYQHYLPTPISPLRLLLSVSYLATATLFLNPKWLRPSSMRELLLLVGIGAIVALLVFDFTDAPAQSLLRGLGDAMMPVGLGILAVMTSLGVLWGWSAAQRAWRQRNDVTRVFLFLLLFALAAAPAKGYFFSSRYVVGGLGVLVLVLDLPRTWDRWLGLRILAGSMAGAISLLSYYRLG